MTIQSASEKVKVDQGIAKKVYLDEGYSDEDFDSQDSEADVIENRSSDKDSEADVIENRSSDKDLDGQNSDANSIEKRTLDILKDMDNELGHASGDTSDKELDQAIKLNKSHTSGKRSVPHDIATKERHQPLTWRHVHTSQTTNKGIEHAVRLFENHTDAVVNNMTTTLRRTLNKMRYNPSNPIVVAELLAHRQIVCERGLKLSERPVFQNLAADIALQPYDPRWVETRTRDRHPTQFYRGVAHALGTPLSSFFVNGVPIWT